MNALLSLNVETKIKINGETFEYKNAGNGIIGACYVFLTEQDLSKLYGSSKYVEVMLRINIKDYTEE